MKIGEKKGIDDIRLVYNATKSSPNDSVWNPWFAMTTVKYQLMIVELGT